MLLVVTWDVYVKLNRFQPDFLNVDGLVQDDLDRIFILVYTKTVVRMNVALYDITGLDSAELSTFRCGNYIYNYQYGIKRMWYLPCILCLRRDVAGNCAQPVQCFVGEVQSGQVFSKTKDFFGVA